MRHRTLALVIMTVLALTGCAASEAPVDAGSPPVATADPQSVPGSTLEASAVTADAPDGLSLAVVAPGEVGEQEQVTLDALDAFADTHEGTVAVFSEVDAALGDDADVIVSIGPTTVGAIDLASASNLDASFLVLGSQLAEPTGNVVAVVWPGADQRAVFAEEEHPFAGADEYAPRAVETGLAAFAAGLDGHVIALD